MIRYINIRTVLYLYITGDNNTLCITIHSLKTENDKSLPTIASMIRKNKTLLRSAKCTAQLSKATYVPVLN